MGVHFFEGSLLATAKRSYSRHSGVVRPQEIRMAYILSKERDGSVAKMKRNWDRYVAYLRKNERRFPAGAYSLATSDWYFGASDHRAPHDAWLEEVTISEPSSGGRNEI